MTTLSVIKLEMYNKKEVIKRKTELSLKLVEISTKNKIGIKIGWNIWKGFWSRINTSKSNEILLELLDDPIVNHTEELFLGAGAENYKQRMNKVQNFLQEIFKLNEIKKIVLDIDAYDTEKEVIKEKVPIYYLKPTDFVKLMFKLHKENGQWSPIVRLIMDKTS